MVLGKSGSGKSTSLRNFGADEVGVFSVAGKRMPFRSKLPVVQHASYQLVEKTLEKNGRRCYVIDDATYLMQFDNFARARETGFGKFTDMAVSFQQLLQVAARTDEDTNVFFLMHPDADDRGHERPKTIGKMLEVLKGLGLPINFANESWWNELGLSNFDVNRIVTRLEAAVVIDAAFDPFGMFGVDYNGNFTR